MIPDAIIHALQHLYLGGQSLKYGKGGQAYRCAAAADRTGLMISCFHHTFLSVAMSFRRFPSS